ncbi:MAG TPA: 3'-5' exonuclease [Galbitalea sp.]|nr:3'-5' exonuclease [Galbitalea sp.]
MSNSWFDTLGVFDLETTGIDVETSRIVSAHVGVLNASGELVEKWNWLANPGVEIPAGASDVHGITTERARAEGRPAAAVIAEIIEVLTSLFNRGLAVTIYNAPYDLSLLHHEALRYNLAPLIEPAPIIDPLVLDRVVDRWRKGKRTLEAAAVVYGVDLVDAHDASADAVAAGRVAQAMVRLHPEQLAIEGVLLHSQQIAWSAEQSADFQDYMRRTHNPDYTTSGVWPVR